jgi:hypothetical protein
VIAAQAKGQPVISVDTKKKELVGNYKNVGSDYCPKGTPIRVKVHDFENKELGKVVPSGIYDVTANAGFVADPVVARRPPAASVAVPSPVTDHGRMEVVSANGRRVIVGQDVDVDVLLRIMRGLETLR